MLGSYRLTPVTSVLIILIILSLLACSIVGAGEALNARWTSISTAEIAKTSLSTRSSASLTVSKDSPSRSASPASYRNARVSSIAADSTSFERAVAAIELGTRRMNAHAPYGLVSRHGNLALGLYLPLIVNGAALPGPAPLLLTKYDSTRAIALETVTLRSEPFTPTTPIPWSPGSDRQTRISLFAMNVGPSFGDADASSVRADAEDFAHKHYPLLVEYVSEVPEKAFPCAPCLGGALFFLAISTRRHGVYTEFTQRKFDFSDRFLEEHDRGVLSDRKGGHGEIWFEGSCRQSVGLTDKNHIFAWQRPPS